MDVAADLDHGSLAPLSLSVTRVAAPVREQVLEQLRAAIVDMRLRPGQRLVERELVEQTGVSRTTIREVLRQLSAEGLVETIPHKGMVVASVPAERAPELYQVRAVLEGIAARQFVERASEEHLTRLREAFTSVAEAAAEPTSVVDMLAAKKTFYDVLFEGAANQTVQEIVQGLQARVTLLRRASLVRPGRPAESVAEVQAIVEAIERRDGAAAADASVRHVNEAGRIVLSQLQQLEAMQADD
jgi:GntR family transcriptional regulator, trigonelline degradation regulator